MPGVFAGPDQAAEHPIEHVRVTLQGLGQAESAFDGLHDVADDLPEAGSMEGVAQIGQAVDDGHAGAQELFQVKAEVDQFAPADAALALPCDLSDRRAMDQVEAEPAQAQFEVGQVGGLHATTHTTSARVYRPIAEGTHGNRRSVRSTTRASSSREVSPSRTRRVPSSARRVKPLDAAAW